MRSDIENNNSNNNNNLTLKCLNDELSDLYKFYSKQLSFVKRVVPPFIISASDMISLRERLLSKIDSAQSLRSQCEDELFNVKQKFLGIKR